MDQAELTQAIKYFKRKGIIGTNQPDTEETWQTIIKADYIGYRLRFYFDSELSEEEGEINAMYTVKDLRHGFTLDTELIPDLEMLQQQLDSLNSEPTGVHVIFSSSHLQPKRVQERFRNNKHHLQSLFEVEFVQYGNGSVEFQLPKSYDTQTIAAWTQTLRTFSALSNEHTTADKGIDNALARN